jgi:hypothetical protein
MVAIREMKRAAIKPGKSGHHAMANYSSSPKATFRFIYRKPLTMRESCGWVLEGFVTPARVAVPRAPKFSRRESPTISRL